MYLRFARADAQGRGLPPWVLFSEPSTSRISARPRTAERGRAPLTAFPQQMMSTSTP